MPTERPPITDAMTFNQVVDILAGFLPEGYTFAIKIERHAGWIEVYDENGDDVEDVPEPYGEGMALDVEETLQSVIEYHEELQNDV